MRTGSTLLAEALTRLPYAFIFREPHIGKNTFQTRRSDVALFEQHGIDLEALLRPRRVWAFVQRRLRVLGYRQDYMVRVLDRIVHTRLADLARQIGVKEIRNRGWPNYHRQFPDMRVILTGRDPRDIYLSVHRLRLGESPDRGTLEPRSIAAEIAAEFELQRAIGARCKTFRVRYEDLIVHFPERLAEIKEFAGSPVPGTGEIGQFLSRDDHRVFEHQLHVGEVTRLSLLRWQKETDPRLREHAQAVFDLLPEYTSFWGYTR